MREALFVEHSILGPIPFSDSTTPPELPYPMSRHPFSREMMTVTT